MTTTTPTAYRWTAQGFTDDVTTCEHCGKPDLKGTVRMVPVGPDGDTDGEQYMGVVCAARMTGRKATDIRTEADRADRERERAIRDAHRAWSNMHTIWTCATRDVALGPGHHPYRKISAYYDSAEFKAAEAAWLAANPEPTRPW